MTVKKKVKEIKEAEMANSDLVISAKALAANERRIGYLIISKRLAIVVEKLLRVNFMYWANFYATRYKKAVDRLSRPIAAAIEIQRWYRNIVIASRISYKNLTMAIQMCLHRRKAIKHMIKFEMTRRMALAKIHKGIINRRRYHFGCRGAQRIYRWTLLFRKTSFRLTRIIACRKIQRWRRMMLLRPAGEWIILHTIIRCGGYSVVRPKLPRIHEPRGFLLGVDACVSQIQKYWYQSKGNMAAFMAIAARKARAAYEAMLGENANIIQFSYRARLWMIHQVVAIIHNRARRIQRSFRSYKWRKYSYWLAPIMKHRIPIPIQRLVRHWIWKKFLEYRFNARKILIVLTRQKELFARISIQRAYRSHVIWVAYKKEQARKFFAEQRKQGLLVLRKVSMIQRNWRQMKNNCKFFPRHVFLCIKRIQYEIQRVYWIGAYKLQKIAKPFIIKKRLEYTKLRLISSVIIWKLAKSYLLKLALWDRILALEMKKKNCANLMKKNFRILMWLKKLKIGCSIRRLHWDQDKMVFNTATWLQTFAHRKMVEYYMPVRIAGRRQLKKKRDIEVVQRVVRKKLIAVKLLVKFFRSIVAWNYNLRIIPPLRRYYKERKAAKKLQKFGHKVIAMGRFWIVMKRNQAARAAEAQRIAWLAASNVIGRYWRRRGEKKTLKVRFQNRRKMLDIYYKLKEEREIAEKIRDEALEDVRRTEENMEATIASSWKQGADEKGRNYYYNYVTGESTWTPPDNWRAKVEVLWIRNLDERQNVYYYNMQTGESKWLPPCTSCGEDSNRWCNDCGVSYCEEHFELNHGSEADVSMHGHSWSLTEYEKDVLAPGEIYCIECKRRTAKSMCTTCWDAYCEECFRLVHRVGGLRLHKAINYKRAKQGWMCVKKGGPEEDYYVHGSTGQTTFEKPKELMTDQELVYYENFESHKKAAEDHVKAIEQLQLDVESATYERDRVIFDAINGGGDLGALLAKKANKGKKPKKPGEVSSDVLGDAIRKNQAGGGFMAKIFGDKSAYNLQILNPDNRSRGKDKSDYIKNLMAAEEEKKDKNKKK